MDSFVVIFNHSVSTSLASMHPLYVVFSVIVYTLALIVLPLFLIITVFAITFLVIYIKELITQEQQPPIAGPVFNHLVYFNTMFDYHSYLARKYCTYRMITPTHSEIYTVDPRNVKHVLKTNFSNYGKGQYNYGIMKDLFEDGIFAVDGEKWRHQRKLASYEFSTKVLRDFSSVIFLANAAKLVAKVSEAATSNIMMDLQELLMKCTLDSIFKVGFGTELNSLSGSDEIGYQFSKAFDDANVSVYWRYVDPSWKIKRILNIGSEASLRRNIKVIDAFVLRLIRRKRKQMKNEKDEKCTKEDILSRFLVESEKDPENMTDRYLRDIILNFLIAGKDTSANTLTWFFYMLCKHPFVQEKVVQEVRDAMKGSENPSIQEFTELDGKSSEKEDVLPDGSRVKKGDGVSYMPYAMGRMTLVWGEDAEEFRPERWIENGIFRPESPFRFVTFQAS
ncbi:hypothetical protein GIB67_019070 [Kingdonia uniflora]|uniref:Cytochrome P450 n=1 Tax=Kingdonia uniflora TaxID=39325 RepID=A0A7J7MZE7_9MAGN|nr:hypothetical protein GIB67_019070 [Kingdonia uniflora]